MRAVGLAPAALHANCRQRRVWWWVGRASNSLDSRTEHPAFDKHAEEPIGASAICYCGVFALGALGLRYVARLHGHAWCSSALGVALASCGDLNKPPSAALAAFRPVVLVSHSA